MVFITIEDFYEKAASCRRLSQQEKLDCTAQRKNGNETARERLIESYLSMATGHIKRMTPNLQTLGLAVFCMESCKKPWIALTSSRTVNPLPIISAGHCDRLLSVVW